MKKIFLLFTISVLIGASAIAQTNTNINAPDAKPKFDVACLQSAIEKRDNAITSAWDTLSSAIKTALEARKVALKDAVAKPIVKERHAAIRSTWEAYRTSVRAARSAFKQSRKAIWKQYRLDAKSCGKEAFSVEGGGGENHDAKL